MKFSFEWLQDFVDITITPEELADRLTMAGFECEGIEHIAPQVKGIVTGKIESISPHPDADKLVITQTSVGTEILQIVTGATNIFEGAIVPVSPPGAVLANGMAIKVSKLRGVESYGMLCSQAELGIAEEASGIWILPDDTPVGVDLCAHIPIKDTVLDLAILPNRGDCQSILGVAREVSVLLNTPLRHVDTTIKETHSDTTLNVSVADPNACPLYSVRALENVQQKTTPLWMQRRLFAMGIRPISVPVDITNYVMLEMGQPLHAFDANKIGGTDIHVRPSKDNEELTTLDGDLRTLAEGTLLIADPKAPLAMAGIMGGASSEVDGTTTNIYLESACFDPTIVRRKALESGVRTESSLRFEKGVDLATVMAASDRAAQLFQDLCAATVGPIVSEGTHQVEPVHVPFDSRQLNQFLGADIPEETAVSVLESLGLQHKEGQVTVPSWRQRDIREWPDLAEEVLRIVGYDAIPDTLPKRSVPVEPTVPADKVCMQLRELYRHNGLDQVITFPMISPRDMAIMELDVHENLQLQNPLTPEESVMRPSLLASLLNVYVHNQNRQMGTIKLVEIGNVFPTEHDERSQCAGLLSGYQHVDPYLEKDRQLVTEFSYVRGLMEQVVQTLRIQNTTIVPTPDPRFHPKKSAQLMVGDEYLGVFGTLHPFLGEKVGADRELVYFELDIPQLTLMAENEYQFTGFSKFPSTGRDIALLIPNEMAYQTVYDTICQYKPKHCVRVNFFDYFESDDLGDNVSMAFRLTYQSNDGTLSDDEVNNAHQKFIAFIKKTLGVSVR